MTRTTIDPAEIAHFAKDSGDWWDEHGPFKPLHRLNPVRLSYIRGQLTDDETGLKPLKGMSILDIGCGGGIVCEPLARMGATVTGMDADANAITTAKAHAKQSGLSIEYIHGGAEDHKKQYDAVLALEIVEHVADIDAFVRACAALVKPGGTLIMSTLNRTPKSFLLGIVAAEYILRWVPQGTHKWNKFVKPSTLSRALRGAGLRVTDVRGLIYNPVKDAFALSPTDIDVNYLVTAEKTR
jgi:2-polyprenyl-6-hydroxyphenyl methylase/3-demethylubiquinone-9 3-methyltransferase